MAKYVTEFNDKDHTKYTFDTKREAISFGEALGYKFGQTFTVYPEEPETTLPTGEIEQAETFNGMCERCGKNPAEKGDFICMDCVSAMLIDMDGDDGGAE